MVSLGALLALAIALWWLLDAIRAGIRPGRWNHDCLFLAPGVNPFSEPTRGAQDCGSALCDRLLVQRSGPSQAEVRSGSDLDRVAIAGEAVGIESILIVAVGQCKSQHFISDEILGSPGYTVYRLTDYRELRIGLQHIPALVLVHDSLLPEQLEDACRAIREKWPITRILVIQDREESLEDWLYDDRVGSDVSGRDLIARILFLVQTVDFRRLRDGKR